VNRLLYLTKNFPPQISGGIRRIEAIYNIFKQIKSFECTTVCAVKSDAQAYPDVKYIRQLFLKDRVYQASISLKYTKSQIPLIDKALLGWLPNVLIQLIYKKYDLVYCTVPIFTNFIIGFIYKKLRFNHPRLIVEYRDLHSFNPEYLDNSVKKIINFFEKWMLKNCSLVIVTTEGMKKTLSTFINPAKIHVIRNYISTHDLEKIKTLDSYKLDSAYYHLGYVGTLNTGRSPKQLLELLNLKINGKPTSLHFVGTSEQQNKIIIQLAEDCQLPVNQIFFHGVVDRLTSLKYMKSFDGLILIINKHASIDLGYGIPGKLYDYVYLNNNIFADIPTYDNLKYEFKTELELIKSYEHFINFKLNDYHTLDDMFNNLILTDPVFTTNL
jgi:hypothetical protein